MLRFVLRRLALLVPILFGLSLLLFLWVRRLPGGPATALLGEKATPEAVARINKLYGFDQPITTQYVLYMKRLLTGDFGVSIITQQPVLEEFLRRFPATVELSVTALLFAIGLGIPMGYLAARHYGRWPDQLAVVGSLIGVSIPVFFLAFILKYLFAVEWGLLPSDGRQDTSIRATHVTNFYVLDGMLTREWDASWDAILHLVLPGIALGTIPLAIIVRMTRASVLEVLNEDYVRTAHAKGLDASTVRTRHILRNAMLPVATTIGLQMGLLLAGAVLTETVFAFNGVGLFLRDAIFQLDYPVLQGFILFIAVIYAVINLVVDISYGILDPRVRVS
ncbi:MAG: ABC transporter permease [Actinomycetota bacterium]|nr:ABC transporter permease [Actinomycetota bacterium]